MCGLAGCIKHLFLPFFLFFAAALVFGEDGGYGSIPQELLRPKRDEAPRYPVDTVIGELGQGRASNAAYSFARSVALGLVAGNRGHPALAGAAPVTLEGCLSALELINCQSFRIGSGREEPD